MLFLIILALILAVLASVAVRKVAQRREAERAARAEYYQSELNRLRIKREIEDANAAILRSTKRLAEQAAAAHAAAVERRNRYYVS